MTVTTLTMKRFLKLCAALILTAAGLAANDAAAQQATVIYGTTTPNVVGITRDGYIIYKATVAGRMTATIIAVAGTVAGGNFAPRPANATGFAFVTLRGLDSCGINGGCDAFGLQNANSAAARLAALIAMGLRTVTMFAASGANLNEQVGQKFILFHLATANKPEHISVFVSAGASANARGDAGWTNLHYAAQENHTTAITLLLSAGAKINPRNSNRRTPLDIAYQLSRAQAIVVLRAAGGLCGANTNPACLQIFGADAQGRTTLHIAAIRGATMTIARWLAAGASVNAPDLQNQTPLHFAAQGNQTGAMTLLLAAAAGVNLPNNSGETPLHIAAFLNSTAAITILLAAGASVDAQNNDDKTPLYVAAEKRNAQAAAFLLSAGASVNAKNNNGETLLHIAAFLNGTAAITVLLSAGAGVNATATDGDTPLDIAYQRSHAQAISALREWGGLCRTSENAACPRNFGVGINGQTTLHIAANMGSAITIARWLAAGANADARDDTRRTPLHYAALNNRAGIITILLSAMADVNARNIQGATPLDEAARTSNAEAAAALIAGGGECNTQRGNSLCPNNSPIAGFNIEHPKYLRRRLRN